MLNMFNGIVIPVEAIEGAISIKETVSVKGDGKEPTVANPVKQGERVAIVGDLRVEKADGTNGTVIGFVHDHPEYDYDPVQDYTKAAAITAGMLRKCGVETPFVDVRTVPAKAGEGIVAGDYVAEGADGQKFEKSDDETNMIALVGQTTDNQICIGIK